ncbi:MAG: hypothetical protein PVH26_13365 [Desulfosarcina sp.]|jgi:hypothetical protein
MKVFLILITLAFCTHCTGKQPPSANQSAGSRGTGTADSLNQQADAVSAPKNTVNQRATIDPETGALIARPQSDETATDASASAETLSAPTAGDDAEQLEEMPSPVAGGGMMIDLKGRFRNPISASVGADGKTSIAHPAENKME